MSDGQLEYNIYPEYADKDFIKNISNRLEFFHLKSLFNITELSKKCPTEKVKTNDPFAFELTNNQQLLRNFMNNKTPYKSLVIFHGVGVGKTCSAVNISKSFRDIFYKDKKKIICLVPKNIRGGWENTIYDPTKGHEQCSGDSFDNLIVQDKKGNISKRVVKNVIRQHYDFHGYLSFANSVQKLIDNAIGNRKLNSEGKEKIKREVIRNNFSHRVLIIDELHNLRDENETKGKDKKFKKGEKVYDKSKGIDVTMIKKEKKNILVVRDDDDNEYSVNERELVPILLDKKTKDIIEEVIRYSKGLRLIMLSATPMFNKSSEIVWLLNLLLQNDNRFDELIKKKDVFDKNDKLMESGREIIEEKCRGYFSYLRGENPITFPIRLHPDINYDKRCICDKSGYLQYPTTSFNGYQIEPRDNFKFMKMYGTEMQFHQKNIYNDFLEKIVDEGDEEEGGINLSDRNIGSQISNIVFHNENVDKGNVNFKNKFGQRGFNDIFNVIVSQRSKKCEYKDDKNQILSYDNIIGYSSKIHSIIENMIDKKPEGIIFIYSDYIYSGILPMAIALEHIGFEKYSGGNILKTKNKIKPIGYDLNPLKKDVKKAKYIILTGDKSLSPNNEKERKASLSYDNMDGENIKVILGNSVTSEGMDFKNIREIHVIDPWYHLYKIEQIIGRGIRYCSHSYHEKKKQNVTVFLHTSYVGDTKRESIDINTYRLAEKKASDIGEVEKILKNNAIDALLNKGINHITGLEDIKVLSTWGNEVSFDINDKPFTKVCSFLEDGCEIDIDISQRDVDKMFDDKNISDDTFTTDDITESIKEIYYIVKELFEIYEGYTINELKERIKELIDTDDRIIEHALDKISDEKKPIWNREDVSGYIVNKNDVFLFQPNRIKDTSVPYFYRLMKKDEEKDDKIPFRNINVNFKDNFHCESSYNDIYQSIRDALTVKLDKDIDKFKNIIPDLKNYHIKNYYIDGLTYEEKKELLKEILCGFIVSGEEEIQDAYDKEILNFFQYNLIYYDNGQYYGFEKKGNVIGFFLCNPHKYKKEQDLFKNFDYFVYDEEWNDLDEVGVEILKANILKNKNLKSIFRTGNTWGYSFKEDKTKQVFKIVDQRYSIYDNEPGKVIGDKGFPMLTLLYEYVNNFKDNHVNYIDFVINEQPKIFAENIDEIKNEIKGVGGKDKAKKVSIFKNKLEKVIRIKNTIETKIKDYQQIEDKTLEDIIEITNFLFKAFKVLGRNDIFSKDFITKMYELSVRNGVPFFSYDTFLFKFTVSL